MVVDDGSDCCDGGDGDVVDNDIYYALCIIVSESCPVLCTILCILYLKHCVT